MLHRYIAIEAIILRCVGSMGAAWITNNPTRKNPLKSQEFQRPLTKVGYSAL